MSAFKNVTCKLGNMRKAQSWVLYPQQDGKPNTVVIQCDNRIAMVDLTTGSAFLSIAVNYSTFAHLHPMNGAVRVQVPAVTLAELRTLTATNKPGAGIGATVVLGTDQHDDHQWGPVQHSTFTGNPHRKCQVAGCKAVTLDLTDELE